MNAIKRYPAIGDIAILHEGKVRFLGQDATADFVGKQQCIGVVYDVRGKEVKLVGGDNDKNQKWSCVCDFEIAEIPSNTGDYEVKLQNAVIGNFHYTRSAGTKAEFVTQLNAYLKTNASKWEAYMSGDRAILQLSDYTAYESTCTIAGCTLNKLIGTEASYTDNHPMRNQVRQRAFYSGMCRPRLGEWARNETAPNNNPSTRMDGVKQLFVTFPCSEAYYNGELGDGLRAHFATYEDYLDACMCRLYELDSKIMAFRDGREICAKLKDKKVMVRGVSTPAYSAVDYAANYDSGVEGFGKGAWWLPSMHELAILMRSITVGTKSPIDPINASLAKKAGWSQISAVRDRWSCCRYDANSAWCFSGIGIASNSYFYYGFACAVVSALTLND